MVATTGNSQDAARWMRSAPNAGQISLTNRKHHVDERINQQIDLALVIAATL